MKNLAIALLAVGVLSFGVSAHAEDGNVSDASLAAFGFDGMEKMSDADGLQVRGMSSSAQSSSVSFASFLVFDPATGAAFSGQAADFSRGTAENAGLNIASNSTSSSTATIAAFNTTIISAGNTFSAVFTAFGGMGHWCLVRPISSEHRANRALAVVF